MRFEGSLYRCSCDAGYVDDETCGACKGYGLLYIDGSVPKPLSDVDQGPLIVFMATRMAALESDHERLSREYMKLASGERERSAAEREFLDSMHDQNRMLRKEVKDLAKTMGLHPASVEGEPWVPKRNGRGILGASGDGGPAEAVRHMVKHHVREAIDDHTTPDDIRKYVDDIVSENIETVVKRYLGINSFNRLDNGPLKTAIEDTIDKHVDLSGIVDSAMADVDLPTEVPDYIKEEAGDQFRTALRNKMRDLAHEIATDLAASSIRDTIEQAVLDEMPWLKRYLAAKRLGGTSGEQ